MTWNARDSARETRHRGAASNAGGPPSVRSRALSGALRGFTGAFERRGG